MRLRHKNKNVQCMHWKKHAELVQTLTGSEIARVTARVNSIGIYTIVGVTGAATQANQMKIAETRYQMT